MLAAWLNCRDRPGLLRTRQYADLAYELTWWSSISPSSTIEKAAALVIVTGPQARQGGDRAFEEYHTAPYVRITIAGRQP